MKERGNHLLRFIDRYLGVPLVFCAGLRRKRPLPETMNSIALLKSAGIGDVVLLSAVIADLRRAYPQARLWLFTGSANREAAALIEGVEVVAIPVMRPLCAVRTIRRYPVDLWIDADAWPRISTLLTLSSRARCHIGFRTPHQYRHFPYDIVVPRKVGEHEMEAQRRLVHPLGIPTHSMPRLNVEVQEKERVVILHQFPAGSRSILRKWDKWQQLADYFLNRGYRVVTTGGSGDCCTLRGVENRVGRDGLRQTAELLARACCVVSVDTGVMHLAAALGSFTIALHGPSNPGRWGGVGKNVHAVTPPFDYTPCLDLGFERGCRDNRCMRAINLNQVTELFERYESSCLSRG